MKNNRYAVVDLETTGTNYNEENRIIQIGCAFIEKGKVIDTFQSKINPQKPIPARITKLTGITNEQVKNAPKFSDIVDQLYSKLVDTVFVAHNVDFDFPFLNQELIRSGYPALDIPAVDTVSLSQIVFPAASGYRLRDLTHDLGIEHLDPHSADSDALATAQLFIEIQERLLALPIVTLDRLNQLGNDLPRQTQQVLTDALVISKKHPIALAEDLMVVNGIALHKPVTSLITSQNQKIKYPHAKKDKVKLFKQTLKWRKTQASLMNYIHQQFTEPDERQNVVIEAPTGMGKTLGYLFPLSYIAENSQKSVVISVPTTILQNQLMQVAQHQLNQILPKPKQFAILKGSSNYLSLDLLMSNLDNYHQLSKDARLIAMKILVWLTQTTTGDLEEANFNVGFSNFIDQVRHVGNTSLDEKSPFFEYDFYQRSLDQVKKADFVVTNHAYLAHHAEDFIERKPYLVIDEAQHFIKSLTSTNQKYIDLNELMMEAHRLVSRLMTNYEGSLVDELAQEPLVTFHIRRFAMNLEKINRIITNVQDELYQRYVISNQAKLIDNQPGELAIEESFIEQLNQHDFHQITQELANTFIEFNTIDRYFDEHDLGDKVRQKWIQIKAFQNNLTKFYDALRQMKYSKTKNVYWITLGPNHDAGSIRIGHGIINTGEFYQTKIEPAFSKTLLIGGTLFVGHNRQYFLDQYALSKENAIVRSFNTGVNFEEQLDFEIVSDGLTLNAETNNRAYEKFIANSIVKLTDEVERQTLILFNSLDTIKNVYNLLRSTKLGEERRILAQGIHGSKAKIIREFNDEENAILLGAASFWEGIDFPGKRLEYLIVTRLPFRSPDDKLVQFQTQKQRNVFQSFLLPDALITFKQGLGRVIRNSDDRGVVVMLDNRIIERKYGRQFINQLPNGVEDHRGKIMEVKQRVDKFFK